MKTFRNHFLAIGVLASFPGTVLAGELNTSINDGATITSNDDNTGGESFTVTNANDTVINAVGDSGTAISNKKDVTINYNSAGANGGTFAITNNGGNVISANSSGAVSIDNTLSVDTNGGTAGGTTLSVASGSVTIADGTTNSIVV